MLSGYSLLTLGVLLYLSLAAGQSCPSPAPDLPNLVCASGVWTCTKDFTLDYDLDLADSQVVFEDSFRQLSSSTISLTLTNENFRAAFLRVRGNASIAGELSIIVDAVEVSNGSDVTIMTAAAASIQGSFSKISVRDDTNANCKYDARQLLGQGSEAIVVRLEQGSCRKRSGSNKNRTRIITLVVGVVVMVSAISVCIVVCLCKKGKLKSCC